MAVFANFVNKGKALIFMRDFTAWGFLLYKNGKKEDHKQKFDSTLFRVGKIGLKQYFVFIPKWVKTAYYTQHFLHIWLSPAIVNLSSCIVDISGPFKTQELDN
jgi:hypothetical protein